MAARGFELAPDGGEMLQFCTWLQRNALDCKWLAWGWVSCQMVSMRLEDCTEWLVRGLSIAPNGSEWPQHKKATIKWQLGDCAGQLKKLRRGNRRVTPAKRKKIMAQQSGYCAGQKKKCGVAINGLHRAKEKITAQQSMDCASQKKKKCSAAIRVSRRPHQKIAARQSGYHAYLLKNGCTAIRVSCLPLQNLRKAWVLHQMVGTRLEDHAEGWREAWGSCQRLAQGLRIVPNGWREAEYCTKWWRKANIMLDGGARLISRLMVAQGLYCTWWWHESNIALNGSARIISRLMVARV